MEMPSHVLCVQKESTVHPLTFLQCQTVMMEPIHGVPRNGVLHAPVDGSVQTRMELGMSNAYQYVCHFSYGTKVCEFRVVACGAAPHGLPRCMLLREEQWNLLFRPNISLLFCLIVCFSLSLGLLFSRKSDRLHSLSSRPCLSKNKHQSNCDLSTRNILSWITNSMSSPLATNPRTHNMTMFQNICATCITKANHLMCRHHGPKGDVTVECMHVPCARSYLLSAKCPQSYTFTDG